MNSIAQAHHQRSSKQIENGAPRAHLPLLGIARLARQKKAQMLRGIVV